MASPMTEDASGVKRKSLSPLPSSITKRAKLDMPQHELTSLNVELNDIITRFWPHLLEVSEDTREMTVLLSTTLMHLMNALAGARVRVFFFSTFSFKKGKKLF